MSGVVWCGTVKVQCTVCRIMMLFRCSVDSKGYNIYVSVRTYVHN